jgi:hypothetical protein
MNEQITPPVDPNHPWAEASLVMEPSPLQAVMRAEIVEIEQGQMKADAIFVSIIDQTGIKNVFLPPQMFVQFITNGAALLDELKNKHMNQGGLIIPNKQMEQEFKKHADAAVHLRSVD